MDNQNQSTDTTAYGENGAQTVVSSDLGGTGMPNVEVGRLSEDPNALSNAAPEESFQPRLNGFWNSWWHRIDVALVILILVGLPVVLFAVIKHNKKAASPAASVTAANQYDTQKIPLNGIVSTGGGNLTFVPSEVVINGSLKLNQGIVISPSVQPATPTAGQLYFDQNSNQLAYYNGATFVPLTANGAIVQTLGGVSGNITLGGGLSVVGNQLIAAAPASVASLAGRTGAVTLGNGLSMNGNTLQNSGVLNVLAGTSISVTNDGNGTYTINNVGAGTGTVTSGGGTAGRFAKFTGAQNVEDSSLASETGSAVVISGDLNVSGTVTFSGLNCTTFANGGTLTTNGSGQLTCADDDGSAGGGITGSGVSGTIPLFNGVNSITNSIVTQSGTSVTIAGDLTLNTDLTVANGGTGASSFTANGVLYGNGGGALQVTAAGTSGQVLVANGSGVPTFVTFSGDVTVSNTGATTIQANSVALGTDTTGGYVANLGSLTGLTTTGNSGEGATPTLSVTYGSIANTAVQGNVALTCPAGSGNLTGGGNSVTLGAGGSCNNISIVNNPTFTTSVTTPAVVLTGGGSNGTIQVGTLGQSTVYTLPDPGGAAATICLSTGNCATAGAAGGDLTGSYPNPTIAKLQGTNLTISAPSGGHILIYNATNTRWENQAVSGDIAISETGVAAVQANAVALGTDTTGNYVIGLTAGNGINVSGSAGEGWSPTVAVVYGSAANTAVQGNTSITVTAGTNLTGGGSITLGAGGTVTLNVASSPTFSGTLAVQGATATIGTSSQQGSVVLNDGSSNTGTVQTAALGQDTVYTLPDPGGAAATICLTTGNCAGTGGGVTTPGGTTNRISKFTGSQTLGDSTISDNGSTVTINGSVNLVIQGGTSTLGTTSQAGTLAISDGSSNTISIVAAAHAANHIYTVPDAGADADFCLSSGNCVGGGGGGAPNSATYLVATLDGTLTNERALAAGTNISLTDGGANGNMTVATVNNPTFSTSVTTPTLQSSGALVISSAAGNTVAIDAGTTIELQDNTNITGNLDVSGTINAGTGNAFQVNATGDVTAVSLTLSTALTVANGGTGVTSLTSNGVLYGNGGGAVQVTTAGTSGQVLVANGSGVPTFVTFSGDVTVSNTGATTIQANSVALGTDTTGNYVATLGTLTGLSTTGNTGEGSTPTLTVLYGSGSNTAVQGDTTLTCASGTGNLTGGGNTITLGAGGSCSGITIVNNPTFTTSVTTPSLVLTGAGSNGTLQVASLGQTTTYTLPDPGGATATICLTTGNCAGTGTSVTTSGGTINRIAKFTGSQAIGDSLLSESGTVVTVNGNLAVAASGYLSLVGGNTASRPGSPTEGMLYYDTTTKALLVYANGKWQADRSTATKIVAMGTATGCSGSAPVASQNADAADYVSTSCTSSQTTINSAISALPGGGGTVYLMEGTYIIDGSISVPSNVTLAGSGPATILKFKDSVGANLTAIVNSDTTNGNNRIVVKDFKIDGNKANNASSFDHIGVSFTKVSPNSTTPGATISGLTIENLRNSATTGGMGIALINSSNSKVDSNKMISDYYGVYLSGSTVNTVSNNTVLSTVSNGMLLTNTSTSNTVASNTIISASTGINVINSSTGNNFTSNTVRSSSASTGIDISAGMNTVTGNTFAANGTYGANLGNDAIFSGNTVEANLSGGILVQGSNITVTGNRVVNNGGAGSGSGIIVTSAASGNAVISSNVITDTAGTGYAIDVQTNAIKTYLSNNTYSGTGASSINDVGTETIYANQQTSNNDLVVKSLSGLNVGITGTATASLSLQGSINAAALPSPAAPTVITQGTAGSTSYTYAVSAYDGIGETLVSTGATIATGNATLTGLNFNRISWARVGGAISYKVYRTASGGTPSSTGLIGTVAASSATMRLDDTGLSASGSTPTANTTGAGQFASTLTAGTGLTVTAGPTVLTGASTGDALTVSNDSSTGNIAVFKDSSTAVVTIADGGAVTLQNTANSNAAFTVKTASPTSSNAFIVDTTTSRAGINLGTGVSPTLATGVTGLEVNGAIRLSGTTSAADDFATISTGNVGARINVGFYTYSASGQGIAVGVASGSDVTARGITVFDARGSNTPHQPSIGVTSVDEQKILGLSWDGGSTTGYLKTNGASNIAISPNATDAAAFSTSAVSLLQDTTVAAGKTLTVTSALTSLTGATSGDALNVSNSTSTGNVAVFKDNSTAVVTIGDGGAVLLQNETNQSNALEILTTAASGSHVLFNADTINERVGIGGVATASKFEVQGGNAAVYNSGNDPKIFLGDSTSAGQNGFLMWDSTNDYFRLESVGTNGVKVKDNNVTIGNIFPSQPLIVASGTTNLFQVTGTTGDITAIGLYNTNTFTSSSLQFGAASTATVQSASSRALTVTGHASSTWSTDSGNLSIYAASTLSLGDSGVGGTINLGSDSSAHTINIGNNAGGIQAVSVGSTNSSSSLLMQGGSLGISLNTPDNIYIGTSDTTGTSLILDTKTSAGDPTGADGAMYYNSNAGKFRCKQAGSWADCIAASGGFVSLQNAYTNSTGGTTSEIILDSTRGPLDIQDRSTSNGGTLGGNLLNLRATATNDSTAGALVFSVDANGVVTLNGGQTKDVTTTSAGSATAIAIKPGDSTSSNGTGAAASLKAGDASSTTCGTACTGGVLTLQGGSATGASGTTRNGGNIVLDGGTGNTAAGSVLIGTNANSAVTVGKSDATATLTFGQSTASQTINIGNATTAAGNTLTVNMATSATSTGKALITIGNTNDGSSLTLQAGTGNINMLTSGNIVIGTSDNTGTLLVLDTKTGSGDPTPVDGAMYYNSSYKQFRCAFDGAWHYCNEPLSLSYGWNFTEDFLGGGGSSTCVIGDNNWCNDTSGANSATTAGTPETGHPGTLQLETGTATSDAWAAVYLGGNGGTGEPVIISAGDVIEFDMNIATLSDISGGTNEYNIHVGLCDVVGLAGAGTADCTDGVYFEYDRDSSANWRYATANGGSRTKTTSSTAVATGWHRFKIVVDSTASNVTFYVDGTSLGTPISATIPTANSTNPALIIEKDDSTGGANRTVKFDYFQYHNSLTTLR